MSDHGTPATFSRAAWLLLPALALPVGWWVGNLPTPEPAANAPVTVETATRPSAAPIAEGPPASATAPDVQMTVTSATRPPATSPSPPARPREAQTTELSQWSTMEDALEESRRNGKPVFIDFSADWCGPCQRLKHQVFEDGERSAILQGAVIPVSIVDQRRETGTNPPEIEELQQRYQVEAFPTLVVFSPATGRTMSTRGFRGADATLEWITSAAKAVQ